MACCAHAYYAHACAICVMQRAGEAIAWLGESNASGGPRTLRYMNKTVARRERT